MNSRTYDPIPPRDVAFLGLGVMGHPMAGHLARAGHTTTVYNRSPAKATTWAAEYTSSSGFRSRASHAARTRSNAARVSSREENGRLNSSA